MMAAQFESQVIVGRKAIVRCIGLIISRFDSQPGARSPAGPGRHVYDLPLGPLLVSVYTTPGGPAGRGFTGQQPVRSLKRAMKLSGSGHGTGRKFRYAKASI